MDEEDARFMTGVIIDKLNARIDVTAATPEAKIRTLQSLIGVLESGLSVAMARHYAGAPEPFPGACRVVMRQCLQAVDLARVSKLLPPREQK
jgi:hypothetical protein